MDAAALATRVRRRELSAVEIVDAVLGQIERIDPELHAFCTPAPDQARAEAGRIDEALVSGRDPGPLAGVPVSIKDLIFTRGLRTTGGSIAYADFEPEEDDIVVERLRRAGAVVIGKTNTSEFGYSATGHNPIFETVRNPWQTDRTPGGSSAGAAVAVATGMGPVAVGSDGGGSVRIPASFCGVYGLKPSFGRIPLYPGSRDPRYPGLSGWESLECYGPLTRTVADAALLLAAVSGPDLRDRHSLPPAGIDWNECARGGISGSRIVYSPDWGYAAVDPEVREIVDRAVNAFQSELGCAVEQASPGWEDPAAAFSAVIVADSDLEGMRQLIGAHGRRMSPHLVDWMTRTWTAEELTAANIVRKRLVNRMARFLEPYDLLVTPTACVAPFSLNVQGPEKIDGRYVRPEHFLAFTFPANLTGQPAASVPAGWTRDGLPVGIQIIGRHLDDGLVLRASAAFEMIRPWRERWPPAARWR